MYGCWLPYQMRNINVPIAVQRYHLSLYADLSPDTGPEAICMALPCGIQDTSSPTMAQAFPENLPEMKPWGSSGH